MCVNPHLCHTHTARAAKVTAQSVPPALGSWHSWLWRALGRLSPKRSSWFRDKLQSQGSAWPMKHMAAQGPQREGGRLSKISHLQFFPCFCCLAVLHTSETQVRFCPCLQLCKSTAQSHHVDSSGHAVSLMNPNARGRFQKRDLLGETQVLKTKEWLGEPIGYLPFSCTKKEFFPPDIIPVYLSFIVQCPNLPKAWGRNCGGVCVMCTTWLSPSCDTLERAVLSPYD